MRKILFFLALGGLVGYVGWTYFTTENLRQTGRSTRSTVVAVETARVKKADLGDRMVFTGSIQAEERYDAAPKIAGIIRQINFNVGDKVQRGDILAVLDDDEHILSVEQAEASLKVAEAGANDAESQLIIAKRDFDRTQNLLREKVVSVQEFDRADATYKAQQAKYETAIAQVELARASLKAAQVRLGYTRVAAEWDTGASQRVIGQRYVDAGALVNVTIPILSVLDINTVRAVISVSEKEYPRITQGDPVLVTTDAFPGRRFQGRVSRIPEELGLLTRGAEVEVAVNNPDSALKPGMFVRADIEFSRRLGAAAAPLEAVVRRDDGSRGMFVVDADRSSVSFQPITEGVVDGKLVELVDGGDLLDREVVILGQHLLKDGAAIRVVDGV
ncbi:MAG: efflux RND transporter periplasmic adaptor subunit [Planctomycetes bacterium]|nr:efflux RND transporter periplasmic adaptor subunit [Planctomycetota bacterium]